MGDAGMETGLVRNRWQATASSGGAISCKPATPSLPATVDHERQGGITMDADRNIESLFFDYFADDAGPAMRYASLQKSDVAERDMGTPMVPVHNRVMGMEENDGDKD